MNPENVNNCNPRNLSVIAKKYCKILEINYNNLDKEWINIGFEEIDEKNVFEFWRKVKTFKTPTGRDKYENVLKVVNFFFFTIF